MKGLLFLIQLNDDHEAFWNSSIGWVDIENANQYSKHAMDCIRQCHNEPLHPPTLARWVDAYDLEPV